MGLEGYSSVIRNLEMAVAKITSGVERGLKKAGEQLKEASAEDAPMKTGTLRRSAYTNFQKQHGAMIEEVGFGKPDSGAYDYAAIVHEDLQAHHAVGEAKFLEKSAERLKDRILSTVHTEAKVD